MTTAQRTKLIIVRHGQTEFNEAHKLDGQSDTKLTRLGLAQAEELSKRLSTIAFDVVYASPLQRSRLTAEAVLKNQSKKLNMQIESRLLEIDCGRCTGMTRAEIANEFPALVKEWGANTDSPFPDGESLKDVETRCIPLIEKIVASYRGGTVLVSGHGSLNKAVLGHYLQIPYGIRFKLKQSNCCINEIEFFDGGDFRINSINA